MMKIKKHLEIIKNILAAMLGVQSQKNREATFQQKLSLCHYIIYALIFVLLFLTGIFFITKMILSSS